MYTNKSNDIVLRIEDLEAKKYELKNDNTKEKIKIMFELLENLSQSYKKADSE